MAKVNTLLRSARLRHRWPVKTAASHAEVSVTTYLRWEQGLQNPHLVNLQALCNAFKVSPEQLGYGDLVTEGEIEPEANQQTYLEKRLVENEARLVRLEATLDQLQRENALLSREAARVEEVEKILAQTRSERAYYRQKLTEARTERAELEKARERTSELQQQVSVLQEQLDRMTTMWISARQARQKREEKEERELLP